MLSLNRILVLVVLADTSRHVVHQAARSARRLHAEVILLHVVTRFSYPAGILERGHEITAQALHAQIVQRAQEDLDQALRPELDGIAVTSLLLRGDPAHEIVKTARDQNVDLIVMSTHGEGIFLPLAAGLSDGESTARKPLPSLDRRSHGGGAGARVLHSPRPRLEGADRQASAGRGREGRGLSSIGATSRSC
jgi:universal stress protein A